MVFDSDILIAGGGLNGSALALALAQAGMSVTLAEPQDAGRLASDNFDGRGYAMALASQRLLKAIGIWPKVAADAQPILDVKVTDGRIATGPSPFVLELDHAEIDEGPMGFMVEDRFLRRALLASMTETPNITLLRDTIEAEEICPGGVIATTGHGSRTAARLLVGCDGRRSRVARRAGIARTGWDYGQTALVCAIAHDKPHHGVAHQYFLPSGPLAILPLPGNCSSIVWTETTDEAARIQALDDEAYLAALRPRFGDFLGQISLAGQRFAYTLNLTLADSFVAPRLALVGDAAHGMHPIAGQGLNAGLKDVAALTEVVALARRRGEDIGNPGVLERYQRWRRFDVASMAAATDFFNRLFSNDNSIIRLGRDIGMGLVNSSPGLRRMFIREAAGLTGELPRLLQGRTI